MKLVLEGYKLRLVFKDKKRFYTFLNVFINFYRVSLICNIAMSMAKLSRKFLYLFKVKT